MKTPGTDKNQTDRDKKDDKLPLEDLAKTIVPPSHEVTIEELKDPGKATPRGPVDNRS